MEIYEEYEKVQHYTNFEGLFGILSSQELWASHYSKLRDDNDFRELDYVQECLPPAFDDINFPGGPNHIFDSMYKAALSEDVFRGYYIISFCGVKDNFVEKNGILSLWRNYGNGYALEFDTKKLHELLTQQPGNRKGFSSIFADVIYENHVEELSKEPNLEIKYFRAYANRISTNHNPDENASPDKITQQGADFFLSALTRFKHPGFVDEREVRLVLMPHSHNTGGCSVFDDRFSYNGNILRLFGAGTELPISRILIHPGKKQDQATDLCKRLLKSLNLEIEVTPSSIPVV